MEMSPVLLIVIISAALAGGAGLVFLFVVPRLRQAFDREKADLEAVLTRLAPA